MRTEPSASARESQRSTPGWRPLLGLVRKESLQILRDPSSVAIAFVLPLTLLLIFGYGVSLDAEEVPVAVVLQGASSEARDFASALAASKATAPTVFHNRTQARQALASGEVHGLVVVPQDFKRRLQGPTSRPAMQAIVDGVDANTGRLLSGYLQGIWSHWLQHRPPRSLSERGNLVELEGRAWYNPALHSRHYLVPSMIAVIMTLIGALLTALIIAREWERGTLEALWGTPITVNQFLLGKLIPYFGLGMAGMAFTTAVALGLFGIPLRGSMGLLFCCSAFFLLAALGMGLLISTLARSQFIAAQVAIITTFLPAFILSGFIFDIQSMPVVIQGITYLIAASYFVTVLQTLFLAGDNLAIILPNTLALIGMATLFLGLTWIRTHKQLE